ncbi:MAG TPA: response regulator, partial [Polyangiaceae bacterium]
MFVKGKVAPEKNRVLLVDDDAGVLGVMRRVLERAGFEVVTCADGHEALTALARGSFDVMLSDIEMPGITGLSLLRAVREHDLDLPVVLMTGRPGVESAVDAIGYGAFRYLIKPVPVDTLHSVIARAATAGKIARSKREYVEQFGSTRFRVGDRAGVDATLDRALSSLWTAYQPIVHASEPRVFAYEALMRAEEPMLPHPGAVLLAAERSGRIHDVGRAVRDSVVACAANAHESWLLFVNLHPEDLLDATLYLEDSPFAALAPRVVLEITERASLDHIQHIRDRV